MKFLLLGAAVICMATAAPQTPEDQATKGLACLQERALEQNNKKIVETALQEIFGNHDLSNVDKYVHSDIVEHNPHAESDGIEAFKTFAAAFNSKTQKGINDVKRISAEGDLVWVHLRTPGPGGDVALMGIFKLNDGKIVEHWDVNQPLGDLKESKNPHPFF